MAANDEEQIASPCAFIEDVVTGKIRFTQYGIQEYRSRFGRAGIDIRKIETADDFYDAVEASHGVWLADMFALADTAKSPENRRKLREILSALLPSEPSSKE